MPSFPTRPSSEADRPLRPAPGAVATVAPVLGVPPSGSPRWSVGTLTYTTGGLIALFRWLLWGDYAWEMRDRATGPLGQITLRSFAAPDWLVGLLVNSLPAAVSLVVLPIICTRSDRHRGRWGRRLPFLIALTPLISLSMIGLAFTPRLGEALHLQLGDRSPGVMACRILVFTGFWSLFEIAVVSVKALFHALINDVVPRPVIGRFFALFRIVSLLTGIIFNFWLIGRAQSHTFEIFIGLGLLYGSGFLIMCAKVKEGSYPAPPPVVTRPAPIASLARYFRECFSQPFYLWFFVATALGVLAQGPVNLFSIFHARSVGLTDDAYGKCLALSFSVSLLISFPLGALADRIHPVRLGIVVLILYFTAMLTAFFVATSSGPFSVAFVTHTVLGGAYLTSVASIRQRLLPMDRFGQFAAAAEMVLGVCNIILPVALGLMVESLGGNYRFVFALGSALAAVAALAYLALFRAYQRQGGDRSFVPP